jgi:hypothetical protein
MTELNLSEPHILYSPSGISSHNSSKKLVAVEDEVSNYASL